MAVTEQQVRVFMTQRSKGTTQTAAAAKAGISERTARRIDAGEPVGGGKSRDWRTRPDPFAEVWDEVAGELGKEPDLQALTLLKWLQERYPGPTRITCCAHCSGGSRPGVPGTRSGQGGDVPAAP